MSLLRRIAPLPGLSLALLAIWLLTAMASRTMKTGLNDWNHVEGIWKPRMVGQTVRSSAQVCIVLPCCS